MEIVVLETWCDALFHGAYLLWLVVQHIQKIGELQKRRSQSGINRCSRLFVVNRDGDDTFKVPSVTLRRLWRLKLNLDLRVQQKNLKCCESHEAI